MKYLLVLLLACLSLTPSLAQEDSLTPAEAAREFYEQLFSASESDYDAILNGLCPYYTYRDYEFFDFLLARGAASADFSTVTFSAENAADSDSIATLIVSGAPELMTQGAAPIVEFPFSRLQMVKIGGAWKVCPQDRLIYIIRPADLDLDESGAFQAALQFYNAFYTGQSDRLIDYTCLAKREINMIGLQSDYNAAYRMGNSLWDMGLTPTGYDYTINTTGNLTIYNESDLPEIINDRRDFTQPLVIRENGWKFCGAYREIDNDVRRFAQAFLGDVSDETLRLRVCPLVAEGVIDESQTYRLALAGVNIPEGMVSMVDVVNQQAEIVNILGIVGWEANGANAISLGHTFDATVRLTRLGNHWVWCQPPMNATAPEATTEAGE